MMRCTARVAVLVMLLAAGTRAFTPGFQVPAKTSSVPVKDQPEAPEVYLDRPDVAELGFSLQTGHFMSQMSNLVYEGREDVEKVVRAELGYDHFHWIENGPLNQAEDTEGFIAANDDVVIVVFRGTSSLSDMMTNAKVVQIAAPETWAVKGKMHKGFYLGIESVWKEMEVVDVIRRLYHEEGKERKLFLAGHSLGAALATVAAARLAFEEDMDIHSIYAVGCPRVFDGVLANEFNNRLNHGRRLLSKCFRVRNNNDIVTRVPPSPFYHHVGTEIYFDRYGTISTSSLVDRLQGRFLAFLAGEVSDGTNDHDCAAYENLLLRSLNESRRPLKKNVIELLEKVDSNPSVHPRA